MAVEEACWQISARGRPLFLKSENPRNKDDIREFQISRPNVMSMSSYHYSDWRNAISRSVPDFSWRAAEGSGPGCIACLYPACTIFRRGGGVLMTRMGLPELWLLTAGGAGRRALGPALWRSVSNKSRSRPYPDRFRLRGQLASIITQVDSNNGAVRRPKDENKGGTHIVLEALVITI
jgi:hypothetical protein